MFKSSVTRMAAAAIIGATIALGAQSLTRGQETYHPTYLVFDRIQLPEESGPVWNCEVSFNSRISALLADYTDGTNGMCAVKVNLSERGSEQLGEQLGDIGLIGIFAATDSNGSAIPFVSYLPSISKP